jgi:hypothetical protein
MAVRRLFDRLPGVTRSVRRRKLCVFRHRGEVIFRTSARANFLVDATLAAAVCARFVCLHDSEPLKPKFALAVGSEGSLQVKHSLIDRFNDAVLLLVG